MLGNSVQTEGVAWFLGHLFKAWGYLDKIPEIEDLPSRRPPPEVKWEDLPALRQTAGQEISVEVGLAWDYLKNADHKGSDVRLDTGTILKPTIWPRMAISPGCRRKSPRKLIFTTRMYVCMYVYIHTIHTYIHRGKTRR